MVVSWVNWRLCTSMIRHLIGKSLSTCTKDILDGTIDEGEVLLICTSTKHPFHDPNHFYDMRWFDSTKEAELLQRLWKQGRIHQPRMLSDSYNHGKEEYLFPYDNYRHQSWFSIMDQALMDFEDDPDHIPVPPPDDDARFAKAISDLSHGKLKLDYE